VFLTTKFNHIQVDNHLYDSEITLKT